jgi:hypothetical protein
MDGIFIWENNNATPKKSVLLDVTYFFIWYTLIKYNSAFNKLKNQYIDPSRGKEVTDFGP